MTCLDFFNKSTNGQELVQFETATHYGWLIEWIKSRLIGREIINTETVNGITTRSSKMVYYYADQSTDITDLINFLVYTSKYHNKLNSWFVLQGPMVYSDELALKVLNEFKSGDYKIVGLPSAAASNNLMYAIKSRYNNIVRPLRLRDVNEGLVSYTETGAAKKTVYSFNRQSLAENGDFVLAVMLLMSIADPESNVPFALEWNTIVLN